MPVFHYTGILANRAVSATVDADNIRAARARLKAEGIYLTQIAEGKTRSSASDLLERFRFAALQRVPDLDLSMFTGQLSTLLGAGIPLVQSLSALTEQVENDRLKNVVGKLRETVNQGTPLADAMAEHPQIFDELYCSMVRAGEASGNLALVLRRLSEYIESRMDLRNKLINAMIYPLLMLGASGIVAGVLLVKVIPTITALLQDLNQELPMATLIVISLSRFLTSWWVHILATAIVLFALFRQATQTQRGRLAWDRFRLRLPVLGRMLRYVAIARFARTLSTLQHGGLDIVRGLGISKTVSGNAVIEAALDRAADAITHGATIASTLRRSGEFPAMVTHMVAVGEASGELDTMLARVADTYDQLVDNSLSRLTALTGPILLLFVASVVVLIILSTVLPLLNLTMAL
ncbi:MAG: type II secretion system F family protein [Myxococcota bacterium]